MQPTNTTKSTRIIGDMPPTKCNHDVKHHKKMYCVGDRLAREIITTTVIIKNQQQAVMAQTYVCKYECDFFLKATKM